MLKSKEIQKQSFLRRGRSTLTLTTLSLLLCFIISSCSKTTSDPKASCVPTIMPPYTESGTNTIACTIDGKVWVNNLCYYDHMFHTQSYKSTAILEKSNGVLALVGESYPKENYSESITLYIPLSKIDQSSTLQYTGGEDFLFGINGIKPPIINYLKLTKLDTINKIYCGKFDLILYRLEPFKGKDSVHIVGFFDVQEGRH